MASETPTVTPYAGLEDVQRTGLPVATCAQRVSRFAFASRQLMLVQAGKMSSVANWEFKAGTARQIYESALHWGAWRDRLVELRGHDHAIEEHEDSKLGDFFAELLQSQDDAEVAIALYRVVLPAYRNALQRYVKETNPLADWATVRLAHHVLVDLDAQQVFGESVLAALLGPGDGGAAWQQHLQAYLEAAGGLDGSQAEQPSFALPQPRAVEPFRLPGAFRRDERFQTMIPKLDPFPGDDLRDKLLSRMWVLGQEMTAAELCATVLFEWDELPYEGCRDLARQCWDETRHSLFGQAALEAEGIPLDSLPNWVGYAGHTMPEPPVKRYAHLAIATEAAQMRHPGGKRTEWEWCRDVAQHALMTTFQDFDWADEVNHVRYGQEWIVRFHFKGNRAMAQAMADETVAERLAYYRQFLTQTPDGPPAKEAFWR
jgi:hypothetical protein